MKKTGLVLSLFLAASAIVNAQITAEVILPQEQFLPGESMPLTVRVVNRSGRTLEMGSDQEWLSFSVESKDGYVVTRKGEVPVNDAPFTLPSAKEARRYVDIAPYFSFPRQGRYVVRATVFIKEWNQEVTSPPAEFDVIIGSEMWSQEVGIPKQPGATNDAPEIRRFTLHQANYLKKGLMLYVQISDANRQVLKVFPVGPMLSFGRPDPQIDSESNLHLFYQSGRQSYNYTVIDPSGTTLLRQTYEMSGVRPKLKLNSDGKFEVVGATRRIRATDLPPPALANDVSDEKP